MAQVRSLAVICAVFSLSSGCPAQTLHQGAPRISQANLPIRFEPAVVADHNEMFTSISGAAVRFQPSSVQVSPPGGRTGNFKVEFSGSQASNPVGVDLLHSQTNYLLGNDPAQWRTHVPNYRQVKYPALYPGIDAVFYGNGRQLEHDFLVAAGADYRQIRMHLNRGKARMKKDGSLSIALPSGIMEFERPVMYQQQNGIRIPRQGSFRLLRNGDITFTVADYDHTQPLVIDPVLNFATYLSQDASDALSIATDAAGNNYITGYGSLGYPVTAGAFAGCSSCTANQTVTFISKLGADGTSLVYSTVVGGNSFAQPTGIAVDSKGNAVVSGWTGATNFPTKNGQPILPQNNNYVGFLLSLSADGSALNFGTLLGPAPDATLASMTYAVAVAIDGSDNSYVTGETGDGFPVTPGALNQGGGGSAGYQTNVYLAKFAPTGTLLYSAVIGDADPQSGGDGPIGANALAVDAGGNAYVAGQAGVLWPISSGAYLQQIPGAQPYANPFVTKVAPDAKSLIYSTYLDYAYLITGISALANGNVFVAGDGVSPNHPTTANAYQKGSSNGGEAFLTELNSTGSALVYATSIGDNTYSISGLALDPVNQNIWIAGETHNPMFPLVTPLQSTMPSGPLGYGPVSTIHQFDPAGEKLQFSTFLGGAADGYASGIAIDTQHRAHVAGAAGYGMYTTPGVYDPQVLPPGQAFITETFAYVALIDTAVAAPALCISPNTQVSFPPVPVGTFHDSSLTITSCGNQPLTITGASTGATVFTVPVTGNQCTQALPAGQSCTLAVRYTPTAATTDTSTLTITSNASIPQTVMPVSGIGAVPKIAAPSSLVFGYTLVGQTSAPQVAVIANRGQAALILDPSKTTVSGDFSIQGIGTCSTPPILGACSFNVYFTPTAPGTRTGTLTITSNDPVNPVVTVPLTGTAYSGAPVPEITSVTSQLVGAGAAEKTFQVFGYGFMPNSVVQLNGAAQPTTYMGASTLQVSIAAASIPAGYAELPLTVVTPSPGGGTSAPFTLTTFQPVTLTNAFLVYEPNSKKLFASVPASDSANPNTIAVIDPVTATITGHIAVGNDPGVLAVSSDGNYLYVALNGDHSIQRINLSTDAIERTFSLPVDPSYGQTTVFDMHVPPSVSTEVVVSLLINASSSEDGMAMFNDAGLVNWIPGTPQPGNAPSLPVDRFTFTNSTTTLYAFPESAAGIDEVSYASTGLSYAGLACCPRAPLQLEGQHLASDGTLLYTDTGLVWDPSGTQPVKTFAVEPETYLDSVIPDGAATGKTYFLNPYAQYSGYGSTTVQAFDQTSAALTGSLSFTYNTSILYASGTQLVRWGTNGFAYRAVTDPSSAPTGLFLFTSSITSAGNLNPLPVASSLSPATVSGGGSDFTLTVNGSGFVSGSTIEWNGTPRITTAVTATQISATIYASDIAAAGTAQITVVSPGPGGGTSSPLSLTIGPVQSSPAVTLAPSSISFAAQAVGTTSAPQTVVLTNTGQGNLSNPSVAITGANAAAFGETTTCGATLAPNASCGITVTFTPAAAGSFSATLAVTDNAPGSPQTISLSGSAPSEPLSIGTQTGGSTSSTVAAGQPASYGLLLTPAAGYSGTVTFTCENLPANASCSFNPASLALSGGKSASFTVKVATTMQTTSFNRVNQLPLVMAALLLLPWMWRSRRPGVWRQEMLLLAIAAVLSLTACGGGSSASGSGNPTTAMVAPGTYTVQVIASDGMNKQSQSLTLIVQ